MLHASQSIAALKGASSARLPQANTARPLPEDEPLIERSAHTSHERPYPCIQGQRSSGCSCKAIRRTLAASTTQQDEREIDPGPLHHAMAIPHTASLVTASLHNPTQLTQLARRHHSTCQHKPVQAEATGLMLLLQNAAAEHTALDAQHQ